MSLSVQKIIESVSNDSDTFETRCLEVFHYQMKHCKVYHDFVTTSKRTQHPTSLLEIPFLPISFFKTHTVLDDTVTNPERTYSSSATTGTTPSIHQVKRYADYQLSFERAFQMYFPELQHQPVLALLPSYLEREGSSLIEMAQQLIINSNHSSSGFYLYNHSELAAQLKELNQQQIPHLLIGVSFALTDLCEDYELSLPYTTVMETGGMKGRKKELLREELHNIIQSRLGVANVVSEYGMTELLSQAYLKDGLFRSPAWMKVLCRDANDPFTLVPNGKSGALNIIDLANLHSCSFIATDDLGKCHPDGFEVLGRMDISDVRGCNLMVG